MNIENETVVADPNLLQNWDFVPKGEDGHITLEKARQYQANQIRSLEKILKECTNQDYRREWEKQLAVVKNCEYLLMSFSEFKAKERDRYLSIPIRQVTEEQFQQALECLPPLHYTRHPDGSTSFCISEMLTGPYTEQYFQCSEGCFRKTVICYDRSTWITLKQVMTFLNAQKTI